MALTTVASKFTSKIDARGGSTIEQQLIKNIYFNGGFGIKKQQRVKYKRYI